MLFFKNLDGNIVRKLKSRLTTLVIPYLLWNCLAVLLFLVKVKFFRNEFPAYAALELTPINLLKGFWSYSLMGLKGVTYPLDFTLWFLRDLIVVIPIAVILYKVFRTSIWVLLGIYLIFVSNFHLPEDYGLINALCYFYAGGIFQHNIFGKPIDRKLRFQESWNYLIYSGVLTFVIWRLISYRLPQAVIEWCTFPIYIFGILGLIALFSRIYGNDQHLKKSIYLRSLFFIYAAHGLWVSVAGHIAITFFKPDTSLGVICAYLTKFVLLWYVNMLIFIILQKFSPSLTAILTGKRN